MTTRRVGAWRRAACCEVAAVDACTAAAPSPIVGIPRALTLSLAVAYFLQLTGTFPVSSFGSVPNLQVISLQNNALTGVGGGLLCVGRPPSSQRAHACMRQRAPPSCRFNAR